VSSSPFLTLTIFRARECVHIFISSVSVPASCHLVFFAVVASVQVQHFFSIDVGPSRSLFDRITALITAEALNQPAWTDRCLLIARTAYQLVRFRVLSVCWC
jgi:hypothetical protein